MLGKMENNRLIRPPSQGVIDGKAVSNYNRLPEETLKGEGWKELEIITPEYDEDIEYLIPIYDEQENKVVVTHNVETIPPAVNEIKLFADKSEITADGEDAVTVTAAIKGTAVDSLPCFVTVNGPPAERADIEGGQVVREFVSEEAGHFRVDVFAGDKQATIFLEAV